MLRILDARTSPIRLLGLAAVATLMLSAGTAQRAEAMTPINPTPLPAAKAASDDMITQVRHGGGGGGHGGGFHGGGGFRGGGFHGGGGHIGGFRGGGFRGGISAASAPHRPFMVAAIATADFATMAVFIATGSIARITAIATSTGAIITAATIPTTTIRAAAG